MWYGPLTYVLLNRCIPGNQGILQLQSNLGRAHLSYLWDHQVSHKQLLANYYKYMLELIINYDADSLPAKYWLCFATRKE